jgi:hypothetical protein
MLSDGKKRKNVSISPTFRLTKIDDDDDDVSEIRARTSKPTSDSLQKFIIQKLTED